MPAYRAHVEIGRPPADVYDYVAQIEKHPEWSADPLEVRPDADDRFRTVARSKGKTIEAEVRVTERRRPDLLAFDVADATGRWTHRFTFTPASGGTRVEREISGTLTPAQQALFWLVLLPVKKPNARRALQRLKETLERA